MTRLQATFIRSSPGFMEEANQRAEVRDKRTGGKDTPTRQGRLAESPVYLLIIRRYLWGLGSGIHYSVITL